MVLGIVVDIPAAVRCRSTGIPTRLLTTIWYIIVAFFFFFFFVLVLALTDGLPNHVLASLK